MEIATIVDDILAEIWKMLAEASAEVLTTLYNQVISENKRQQARLCRSGKIRGSQRLIGLFDFYALTPSMWLLRECNTIDAIHVDEKTRKKKEDCAHGVRRPGERMPLGLIWRALRCHGDTKCMLAGCTVCTVLPCSNI